MAVEISLNASSPAFSGMDLKHVTLVIGAVGWSPMFYNFKRSPGPVGSAGTNNKIFAVNGAYPLMIENQDFALIATNDDAFYASRTLSPLVDFMRKNLVIVKKDGTPLTADEIQKYVP